MAEEEVVILEASALDENFAPMQDEGALEEAAAEKLEEENAKRLQEKEKKKRTLLILGGAVFLLLITIGLIVALMTKKEPIPEPVVLEETTEEVIPKPQFSPSKLETMIKKANLLYEQGNKEDALKIYEHIATFNEAISFYNIGVAKMKEQNFSEALEAFKNALS